MRFGILGPTRVWLADGQTASIGGARLRALLARLLIAPGRLVGTGRLIDDLYGDRAPAGAANALQSQVSRLRRALPEPDLVEFHPAGYRLAVAPEQVDAQRFEDLAVRGRQALAERDPDRAREILREALACWRGPALADLGEAPFAAVEAARLAAARLDTTEDVFETELRLAEAGGRPVPADLIPELRRQVASHPLRERLWAQLMRALAADGRVAEALAAFDRARGELAERLGADPSPELAGVHRAILRGGRPGRHTRPPVPAVASGPSSGQPVAEPRSPGRARLPAQLTRFVGREQELARLAKALGETRLVTITGPGGAGKTRLAVEAAGRHPGEAAGRHPGDVRFVELAAVTDGSDVPQVVLGALGFRQAGLRAAPDERLDPTERLVAALGGRPMLLVLDNCEHVVGAVARLAGRLLAGNGQLRILATSREPLGITGEVLCPLAGLALPPAVPAPSVVWAYPAAQLFADRAAEVAPGRQLDSALVYRICRALDGLPLAIELAAARLRTLSLAELAARLDDRFRLLTRGSRSAEPRHQTLRAVVDWSWDLLSEPEQVLARWFAVFAGGATPEALQRVVVGLGSPPLEVLSSLTDKSLVELQGDRYRMLETIRAYAAERLVSAGEQELARRAHAAHFLELAVAQDHRLRTGDQLAALSILDAEQDNLHAALQWATADDHGTALRLVAALSMYWWLRGRRSEAAAQAGALQTAIGSAAPELIARCPEEYALCVLNAGLGAASGPAAPAELWQVDSVIRRLGRLPRQPFLLYLSAVATGPPSAGPKQVAAMLAEHAARPGHDAWSAAAGRFGLGLTYLLAGEPGGDAWLAESLAGFRAIGDRWGAMMVLANQAEHGGIGDKAAEAAFAEALRLAAELGSAVDAADLRRARGERRLRGTDTAGACTDLRAAAELAARAGAPEVLAAARAGLAELAAATGEPAQARRLAEQALAECPTGWFAAEATRAGILTLLSRLPAAGAAAGS